MKLSDRQWDKFFIKRICDVCSGRDIYDAERIEGNIPYITSGSVNNGVKYFISNINDTLEENAISVNRNGSVGYAFYHKYKALYSNDCRKLKLKEYNNEYVSIFITQQIMLQKEKYNYGYKMGTGRLQKQYIMLPINDEGAPDFDFMERYIKEVFKVKKQSYIAYAKMQLRNLQNTELYNIEKLNWKSFYLEEIFSIKKGNQNKMNTLETGLIPLVSAKKNNNAYKDFVTPNHKALFAGNCITINNDGDGGAGLAFYQPYTMALDSHCTALIPLKDISKEAMLFLARCLTMQNEQFGHGHALSNNRMKTFKFMLPVNDNDEPDYTYMEQYIKNIMMRKYQNYLSYIEK